MSLNFMDGVTTNGIQIGGVNLDINTLNDMLPDVFLYWPVNLSGSNLDPAGMSEGLRSQFEAYQALPLEFENPEPRVHFGPQPRKEVVKGMLTISEEKKETRDCAICLEKGEQQVGTLTCNHCLHLECALTWFVTSDKDTCPVCRKNLFAAA